MNSRNVLLSVLVIVAIGALAYLFTGRDALTGNAVQSFSAAVTVTPFSLLTGNVTALTPPVAGGAAVTLSVPIMYAMGSSGNVTIDVPNEFVDADNWVVYEGVVQKTVYKTGNFLTWYADHTATNPALRFTVPAPTITLVAEQIAVDYHRKEVAVSANNHLTNVTANVVVQNLSGYRLYEYSNGWTDVTATYGLTIVGTAASWSGFSLSTKRFLLVAGSDEEEITYGRRKYYVPDEDNATNSTEPLNVVPAGGAPSGPYAARLDAHDYVLAVGEQRDGLLHIDEHGAGRVFTIYAEGVDIALSSSDVTLRAGESRAIPFTVRAPKEGVSSGRIVVSDGTTATSLYVTVMVAPLVTDAQASAVPLVPEIQSPASLLFTPLFWVNVVLAAITLAMVFMAIFKKKNDI